MSLLLLTTSVGSLATLGVLCAFRWRKRNSWARLREDDKDLTGKIIVITGGNVGLGYETALELAKRNAAKIVIGCRNSESALEAKRKIEKITGIPDQVTFIRLDLSDLESVRDFATEVNRRFDSVYRLILNAGVWFPMDREMKTKDGYEIHFGVHHLAHFLLTHLLMPLLVENEASGEKPRVVVVSSTLMYGGSIDMETKDFLYPPGRKPDLEKRSRVPTGYADSKLMNGLFAKALSEKFGDLDVVSVCPGWCYTNLNRNVPMSFFKKLLLLPIAFMFMRSAKEGSWNILHAVLSDDLTSGGFYKDGRLATKEFEKITSLKETSNQLWDLSMELTRHTK